MMSAKPVGRGAYAMSIHSQTVLHDRCSILSSAPLQVWYKVTLCVLLCSSGWHCSQYVCQGCC